MNQHQAQIISNEKIGKVLPLMFITISNAKKILLDIHHFINPIYLQSSLNEFCHKFNRRYFGEALCSRLFWFVQPRKLHLGIKCEYVVLNEDSISRIVLYMSQKATSSMS